MVTGPGATPVTSAVSAPVVVTVALLASDVIHVIVVGAPPSAVTWAINGALEPT
jgi:hypothetical protein